MIIAVIAVWMMQVAVDEVIDVVAVRDRRMSTAFAMHVRRVVCPTLVRRRAAVRVGRRNSQGVFLDNFALLVMQVAIVEIVGVPIVLNGDVATTRAVLVGMARVSSCIGHDLSFLQDLMLETPFRKTRPSISLA